tara:strand:- start:348 stop:650 length:303 start_codon:yes stop_codon:yes gene_type:complete
MGISRYAFSSRRKQSGKSFIGTSRVNIKIRKAVMSGELNVTTHTLEEGERLDSLAALFYGESSYWWIIASASGIGWSLQIPPGTLLIIPTSLAQVMRFMS